MQPVATDQDFREQIVRGLRSRVSIDLVRLIDVGRAQDADWDVLGWAAEEGRVLLTHDARTMTAHLNSRLRAGLAAPRVILVPQNFPIGRAIDEIVYILSVATDEDWDGYVLRLPLTT